MQAHTGELGTRARLGTQIQQEILVNQNKRAHSSAGAHRQAHERGQAPWRGETLTPQTARPQHHLRAPQRSRSWPSRMWARVRLVLSDTEGAATAEYAVVILAAVGFAGLLVLILRSEEVRGMLVDLVQRALTSAG